MRASNASQMSTWPRTRGYLKVGLHAWVCQCAIYFLLLIGNLALCSNLSTSQHQLTRNNRMRKDSKSPQSCDCFIIKKEENHLGSFLGIFLSRVITLLRPSLLDYIIGISIIFEIFPFQ